jgi:hypothetical protein
MEKVRAHFKILLRHRRLVLQRPDLSTA